MLQDFLGRSSGKSAEAMARLNRKSSFPVGMYQTEICVLFLESRLSYQFQAFAAVFGKWDRLVQMVNVISRSNPRPRL